MEAFFMFLIGWGVFLILMVKDVHKKENTDKSYVKDRYLTAIDYNKIVYQGGYKDGKPLYYETKTNRQVFKGVSKLGLERWFYTDNNKALVYPEDNRIKASFTNNAEIAKANGNKWFVIENFWDDSIYDLTGMREASNTYLDDFRSLFNFIKGKRWNEYARKWNNEHPDKIAKPLIDMMHYKGNATYSDSTSIVKKLFERYFYVNNPVNQKVYIKNMRPYQLYLLARSDIGEDYRPIKYKQYLIRFGKINKFNYDTQRCITDKQVNELWSKWYAISKEEYLSLTMTTKDISNGIMNDISIYTVSDLKNNLKPISESNIAFEEGNKKIKWDMNNCGIIRAFDKNGNFVEDK